MGMAERREFSTIVSRLPVAIFRTALDGRVMMANPALADLLGYESVAQLQRVNAAQLYADPSDRTSVIEMFEADVMPPSHEVRLRRRDGTVLWARVESHAVREEAGPRYLEGIITDITEHRRAEDRLRASEERFRKVFEHSPVGMLLRARDGRADAVNPALCAMLDMSREELQALPIVDLAVPEDRPSLEHAIGDLLAGRTGEHRSETRLRTLTGEVTVLAHMTKLHTPTEGPLILAQLVDVTDKRLIQEHLERLVRSKDELVRSVSHELRTPLTAVVGFAEELDERQDIDGEERADLLRVIARQSREMAELIEDLLAAATADGGVLTVRSEQIDIAEACRDVLEVWPGRVPELEVHPNCGEAIGDPFRVRQILRNLLTNARRYGSEPIDIVVGNGSSTVRMQVRDRGPGLPSTEWESIFAPYRRAHEDNTDGGVGLGLSVSRHLARMMRGDLVYSVQDGLSVFELSLPAAAS